jgi:putative redox protein
MGNATVRWVHGQQFVGTDSTKHSVVLSTADEGTGMKPSDMLMVALAACSAVDVVDILCKKRTPCASLEIQVSGEQASDPPWPFQKLHLKFILGGKGLTEKNVAQVIQLSVEKYCSVAATVRGVAELSTEFEILPE